jgi:hypothetical protein
MDSSHDRIATEAPRPSLRERARQAIEDGNTSDDAERLRLLEELHGELEGELERDLGEASPRR